MHENRKKVRIVAFLSLFTALILTGCNVEQKDPLVWKTTMHQVKTKKKLLELLDENNQNSASNSFQAGITDGVPPTPESGSDNDSASRDYVDTNVQVEGVDEGDVIKTDGYQIFYAPAYSSKLLVYDVGENYEITLTKEIITPNLSAESLYLTDEYLIAISYGQINFIAGGDLTEPENPSEPSEDNDYFVSYSYHSASKITIYDRTNFEISYELELNYYITNHRLINNSLFFVGNKYIYERDLVAAYRQNSENVKDISYNDIYYFDDSYVQNMTVVGGLLLNSSAAKITQKQQAYLTSDMWLRDIYVSHNNLYILSTNYVYKKDHSYQTTTISMHSLNVNEATTKFVAASNVKGSTLSQFSADEHDGYFRIATTEFYSSWRVKADGYYDWQSHKVEVTNYLYILKANASANEFTLVGHLDEGLGKPGESIKSVRFDGDRAMIVTFLQTDPLYVINLKDPANPVITDAIELPGFDVYQHNWGNNKILGFGYNADANGIVSGMKLTAYDITEGNAHEIETHIINSYNNAGRWSYAYSEALWNHLAMLVSPRHGLFGIPMSATSYYENSSGDYIFEYVSSYYLFKIDFTQEQVISNPLIIEHPETSFNYGNVNRAVMIEDYVYTFSNHGVVTFSLLTEEVVDTLLN